MLDGEDPQTRFARDARHWINVYRELVAFNEGLLERIESSLGKVPASSRGNGLESDLGLISGQLERYRRRLEFWYARHWELDGLVIDDENRSIAYRDRSVMLTRRELQLFTHLAASSPGFVSARRLLVDAWHDGHLPEESLRTYVVRLRLKLEKLEAGVAIVNRPRRGYSLVFSNRP